MTTTSTSGSGNNKTNKKTFAGNALWVNLDQVARALPDIIIIIIIARLASRELLGQYQILMSVFMIVSIAGLTGFNKSLTRALSQSYDGTLDKVTVLSRKWSILGAAVVFVVGYYWKISYNNTIGLTLMITSLLAPIFHVMRRWQVVFHAKEKFKQRTINNTLASLTILAIVSATVFLFPNNLMAIFLSYIGTYSLLHTFFYYRSKNLLANNNVESGWKSSGYKLLLSEVFNVAYSHLDKLILAIWLGAEGVAVYAVAILFGEAAKRFFTNILAVFIPTIYRTDLRTTITSLRKNSLTLILILTVTIIGLWFLIDNLLVPVFSAKYTASIKYAQLYLFILPGYLLASIFGHSLIREKREGQYVSCVVIAGLANTLLYIVLIPIIGIYGAVIGSVGYYAIMATLLLCATRRFLRSQSTAT